MHIWNWADAFLYSFLPFGTMLICTCVILTQIRKRTKMAQTRMSLLADPLNRRQAIRIKEKNARRNKQILFLLTANNFYFIVSSLPYCITHLIPQDNASEYRFLLLITYVLAYSNNSVNIVFYLLFSQKYRNVLVRLIQWKNDEALTN
jgi:hypothetical protein